ncbi:hypothetical protein ACGF3G_43480 [Streptomyces sp. NPDC048179]|uniref:hypothetical protein n=1 Tax=Streptomyces sp. NPDC048179 TaxID=3365506 RepID=UPI0037102E02
MVDQIEVRLTRLRSAAEPQLAATDVDLDAASAVLAAARTTLIRGAPSARLPYRRIASRRIINHFPVDH